MIPPIRLPAWVQLHLANDLLPQDVHENDWGILRKKLSRFNSPAPLVSLVMPIYNEEANLMRSLSSIGNLQLPDHYAAELLIVNDGSTDQSQMILDRLEIQSIPLDSNQGRAAARSRGLEAAKGQILLHIDADTLYPPDWGLKYIEQLQQPGHVLAYGPHAFIPSNGKKRWHYLLHESAGKLIYALRRRTRGHINVHGFNSGIQVEIAKSVGSYHHDEKGSEDGQMAFLLQNHGKLVFIQHPSCIAWTSDRRIQIDGGLFKAFWKRFWREGKRLREYLFAKKS